jgi:hypothetical protein
MIRKKARLRIPLSVTVTLVAVAAVAAANGCKKQCPVYDGSFGGGPENPDGGLGGSGGVGAGGGSTEGDCVSSETA